jgi:hypothetical protein
MYIKNTKVYVSTSTASTKYIHIIFKRTDLMVTEEGPSGSMLEAEYTTKKVSDKYVPKLVVIIHNEDNVVLTYENAHEVLDLVVDDYTEQDEDDTSNRVRLEKNDYMNNEHKTLTLKHDWVIVNMRKGKINHQIAITMPTMRGGMSVDTRRYKDLRNSQIDLSRYIFHIEFEKDLKDLAPNLITGLKSRTG